MVAIETLRRAIAMALRSLRATPFASTFSLIVLALSIAAATVAFSVVDAIVFRALPFEKPSQLVVLGPSAPTTRPYSNREFSDLRLRADTFDSLAGAAVGPLASFPGRDTAVRSWQVTATIFEVFRIRPVLGRVFTSQDEAGAHGDVAIISVGAWQRDFGGAPDVLEQSFRITTRATTRLFRVVGVVPDIFDVPAGTETEVWIPLGRGLVPGGDARYLTVFGRLGDDVDLSRAQAQLQEIATSWPDKGRTLANPASLPTVVSLRDALVGDVRGWMLSVLAAATLVMVTAFANVGGLMLAKIAHRRAELAVYSALGASPRQLGFSLVFEAVLLSTAAAAIAVLVSWWGVALARDALPGGTPMASDIALNHRVLAAAGLAALICSTLVGTVSWSHIGLDPTLALLGRRGISVEPRGDRLGHLFVSLQAALVCCLLVPVGTFMLGIVRTTMADLGFDRSNLGAVELRGSPAPAVEDALRQTGAVRAYATVAGVPPLLFPAYGGDVQRRSLHYGAAPDEVASTTAAVLAVSSGYFETLGISLLRGRTFTTRDVGAPVVILDEHVSAALFRDGHDPIGSVVRLDGTETPLTVVGIVGSVRTLGPYQEPGGQLYRPQPSDGFQPSHVVFRTSTPIASVAAALADVLGRRSPQGSPSPPIRSMEAAFAELTKNPRAVGAIVVFCGAAALLLGLAGVYAATASLVGRRTKDLAIRMALGATRSRLLSTIALRTMAVQGLGALIGIPAGIAVTRILVSTTDRVPATEPLVLVAVAGVLVVSGLTAALVPAAAVVRPGLLKSVGKA